MFRKIINHSIFYNELIDNTINNKKNLSNISEDDIVKINENICLASVNNDEYLSIHQRLIYRLLMRHAILSSSSTSKDDKLKKSLESIILRYDKKLSRGFLKLLANIIRSVK